MEVLLEDHVLVDRDRGVRSAREREQQQLHHRDEDLVHGAQEHRQQRQLQVVLHTRHTTRYSQSAALRCGAHCTWRTC